MLEKIKVTPLAAESFGVRSMCTLVETSDITILLDAGISITPYRSNLLPHPIEFQTISQLRENIAKAANKAQIVTISHYHFDHHTPSFEDWLVNWTKKDETAKQIYQNKTVLLKNPREKINVTQRQRAWMFQKTAGKYAAKLAIADAKTFTYGKTTLSFSEPVPHGPDDSSLGWVIMATISYENEKFMHAPDIQGPTATNTLELIKTQKPDLIMLGGPPFYLAGTKVDEKQLNLGIENLKTIVEMTPITILEHHALREADWTQRIKPINAAAEKTNHQILTAAEYAGKENLFLESQRKQLYEKSPPSKEFIQWTKENEEKISHIKPPI